MSQEPCERSVSKACLLGPIRSVAMRTVSSGRSIASPSIFTGVSRLLSSTCGGRPGEKIKSLTCGETRSMVASTIGVGTGAAAAGAAPAGTADAGGVTGVVTGNVSSQPGRLTRCRPGFSLGWNFSDKPEAQFIPTARSCQVPQARGQGYYFPALRAREAASKCQGILPCAPAVSQG